MYSFAWDYTLVNQHFHPILLLVIEPITVVKLNDEAQRTNDVRSRLKSKQSCINVIGFSTHFGVSARFWVLEVVARMPYFAYISMLHLYESLGWWRAGAELRRVSQ